MAEATNNAGFVLRPESPIDDLAAATMQTIARRGRGFVLDVDKDGDGRKVEIVESLPPIDEYEAPAAYRGHEIADTDSFIAYCLRYGGKDKSLVFVGDDRCVVVIDEEKPAGSRELVELENTVSADWREWSKALGGVMTHKTLGALMRRQEHNLASAEILLAVTLVKSTATVNHESDLRDVGGMVGVSIRVAAGDEMAKFPKSFALLIPVLAQDELDAKVWVKADVKLEVVVPDEPGKPLAFALHCSVWNQLHRRRLNDEANRLREGLKGWTVVRGEATYVARTLGRKADHYSNLDSE